MNNGFEFLKGNQKVHKFLVDYGKQIRKTAAISILIIAALFVFAARGGEDAAVQEASGTTAASETVEGTYDLGAAETGTDADALNGSDAGLNGQNADQGNLTGSVFVDIGGAVVDPRLAELPNGSRVEDAINAAGGLTEDADMTLINRAELLTDGEKIYIPTHEETAAGIGSDGNTAGQSSTLTGGSDGGKAGNSGSGSFSGEQKININTADTTQLQTLSGIGPVTAQKIIDYRENHGRFDSIEDIKNVSGIGEKTFEKLKDSIKTK